jgi:chemotaxis response regulator CheB
VSITALIIDDEQLALDELKYLLDSAGDVEVLGQGHNGIEAVEMIRTLEPDSLRKTIATRCRRLSLRRLSISTPSARSM